MPSKLSIMGDTVLRYCKTHPTASTAAIARMLLRDEPRLFSKYDNARAAVRYHRGLRATRDYLAPNPVASVPFEIPPSDAKPVKPVPFTATGKGVILADLHFPYHDADAIRTAITYALDNGHSDYCILLGDALDCYQLSRFEKDPRERDFAGELRMFGKFLDVLTPRFKQVWYKLGNHEVRYERYLMGKAPELLSLPALQDLPTLLDYDDKGERLHRPITYVKANQLLYAGKLTLLHGHEVNGGGSAVNPARGMYLKAVTCTVSAHQHKTSDHTDPNLRGVLTSCWSIGCLCDVHPAYACHNRWNLGFALMKFDGHDFEIANKRIVNGQVF
jgi:hypothetical protein